MLKSLQGEPLIIPEIVFPSMEFSAIHPIPAVLLLIVLFARGLMFSIIEMPRTIKKVLRARRIKNLKINPLDWIR